MAASINWRARWQQTILRNHSPESNHQRHDPSTRFPHPKTLAESLTLGVHGLVIPRQAGQGMYAMRSSVSQLRLAMPPSDLFPIGQFITPCTAPIPTFWELYPAILSAYAVHGLCPPCHHLQHLKTCSPDCEWLCARMYW